MIVAVTGGRHFADYDFVKSVLDELEDVTEVWEGGASGADALARRWAKSIHLEPRTFVARWNKFGPKAGPIRNQKMINTGPDLLVAFPGGDGTADCVRRALKAGIKILDMRGSVNGEDY